MSFEVFTVEALGVLLSSDVSDLLSQEALVGRAMSSVIMWAPQFKVRPILACIIHSLAHWLMKPSKVKGDHNIISILLTYVEALVVILLSGVVVRTVNDELLRSTFWFDDNVVDEDWLVGDLEFGPGLTFVP